MIVSVVSYNDIESPIAERKLVQETASREWRSKATPTTDCEALLKMVSESVDRKPKESNFEKTFSYFRNMNRTPNAQ